MQMTPPQQYTTQKTSRVSSTYHKSGQHPTRKCWPLPYLGSLLSSKADTDFEINHHLSCANGADARLRKRVYEDRDLRVDTKLLLYKAVVLPTLLYGAESWTTYSRHLRALELKWIKWEDRRTNISVREEAKMPSATTTIMQHQLRWTGHPIRMSVTHLQKHQD